MHNNRYSSINKNGNHVITTMDLSKLIEQVPSTRLVLYYREMRSGFNEGWKTWAWDMMKAGYQQSSIVQLAGEDLSMNPFEFDALVKSIFDELELDCPQDTGKYQYVLWVAHQVVDGKMSAEDGFSVLSQAAVNTNFHDAFLDFYYLNDDADLLRSGFPACYGDGTMHQDNIEEWMTSYFKKLLSK